MRDFAAIITPAVLSIRLRAAASMSSDDRLLVDGWVARALISWEVFLERVLARAMVGLRVRPFSCNEDDVWKGITELCYVCNEWVD